MSRVVAQRVDEGPVEAVRDFGQDGLFGGAATVSLPAPGLVPLEAEFGVKVRGRVRVTNRAGAGAQRFHVEGLSVQFGEPFGGFVELVPQGGNGGWQGCGVVPGEGGDDGAAGFFAVVQVPVPCLCGEDLVFELLGEAEVFVRHGGRCPFVLSPLVWCGLPFR